MNIYQFTVKDRFLKYVKYDTQSDENSKTKPSTEKQLIFARELLSELNELGIDASMDEYGYIYAIIPSNTDKQVPPIGFMAHIDTAPAISGTNVKPLVHENYQGGNITLPKDNQIITTADNQKLHDLKGNDIITSDGSTLLGADDKAGVASIMDAINYLVTHPHIKHGDIMIAFTVDEEIGAGLDNFDLKKFGAKYAYTLDGGDVGEVEFETFNADSISIKIYGRNIHSGYAKDKMINAIKIAAEFIEKLPKDRWCPEKTSEREGFVHVDLIEGLEDSCIVRIRVRDFDEKKLIEYEHRLKEFIAESIFNHPGSRYEFEISEQYRNPKSIMDKHPQIQEYTLEAMRRIGIKPEIKPVRGGTDGCKLSFMGIPTPNLFCGEHNFHSRTEWVSVQEMEAAVRTIVEICKVWEEKS